jgi:GntR family transcriptional regulator
MQLLGREVEQLVVEAKRLGIDLDAIQSSIAQHWDLLSPDEEQRPSTPEDGGRRKR